MTETNRDEAEALAYSYSVNVQTSMDLIRNKIENAAALDVVINPNVPVEQKIVAIIIVLIVGALIGVFQGFWIVFVRFSAFIVTVAGMLLLGELTVVILSRLSP